MLRGLINGQPSLTLGSGAIRVEEALPPAVGQPDRSLRIIRELASSEIFWDRWVDGMAGHPTSTSNRSNTVDFVGHIWEDAGLLLLGGAPVGLSVSISKRVASEHRRRSSSRVRLSTSSGFSKALRGTIS